MRYHYTTPARQHQADSTASVPAAQSTDRLKGWLRITIINDRDIAPAVVECEGPRLAGRVLDF